MSVRVRFAPSPTGYLHVGGARTALYNYLFAKKHGGKFILRIEDTDKERSTEASIQAILDGLKWLNLNWDEGPETGGDFGPYFQSQRNDTYFPYINKLLQNGNAYKCFCTKEELDAMREAAAANKQDPKYNGKCRHLTFQQIAEKEKAGIPYVIRIKIPEENVTFHDHIRGEMNFSHETLDDFIIVRSDGSPVYNFVVTIDDLTMKITYVIRGEDHISNTPKQIVIFRLLGEKEPEYAHIPLILGKDKKRLSKRHGATSTDEYRKAGYPVDAFVNYLALVGWAYDDKTTIFKREDLIRLFTLEKVSKSGGVFDEEKLNWISGVYIREMSAEELYQQCLPYFQDAGLLNDSTHADKIKIILPLFQDRVKVFSEMAEQIRFFFQEIPYDANAEKTLSKTNKSLFLKYIEYVDTLDFNDSQVLHDLTVSFIESQGFKLKDLMAALRAGVSYRTNGPDLFQIFKILGKQETLKRLNIAVKMAEG